MLFRSAKMILFKFVSKENLSPPVKKTKRSGYFFCSSFMLAGRNAFSTAFKEAGPKILEPVYDVEVSVPADYLGDVMSDLQGRRAIIMGMNSEKGYEKLLAKVPLKEMSSYSTSLSSITGGRASFTMKFSSYELVPSDVQDKLLKAYEATQAED